jgi:hypothetical protein
MAPEQELEKLTDLCRRFGAQEPQARVMAAQLQKRATQLAAERGQTREEAMAHLLRIVVDARSGNIPQS